jgi:hypothetical protein
MGPPQRKKLLNLINAKLIFLFVDVICIFAEDYGGLVGVVEKLTSWTEAGSASSLPVSIRPRIIVVTRMDGEGFDTEILHFRSQLFSIPKFLETSSSLNVVNIMGKLRPSSASQFSALREVLAQEAQASRLARASSSALFSSTHLASFFEKALIRFYKRPEAPFNFIQASRDGNSVSRELRDHIDMLMSLCLENRLPESVPLTVIASAILLDSYPPDMHRM